MLNTVSHLVHAVRKAFERQGVDQGALKSKMLCQWLLALRACCASCCIRVSFTCVLPEGATSVATCSCYLKIHFLALGVDAGVFFSNTFLTFLK